MLLVALVFLWRQSYLGYSLALAIAALLIAREAILVLTYAAYLASPEIVSSLVLESALPTLILLLLGHLYRAGRLRNLRWI